MEGGKRSGSRKRSASALRRFAAARKAVKKSHPGLKSFKKGSVGHKLVCKKLGKSKPKSCRRKSRSRSRKSRR